MPKFNLILLVLFLVLFSSAYGEVIDGPANFRLKPNGPILFSLRDGQKVECGTLKNGWFQISIDIGITDKQFKEGYGVKKGDKVFDFKGKLIGVALLDIPDKVTILSSGDMEILGYVSKSNIKSNSIPENVLDSAFKSDHFGFTYDSLKYFMHRNGYEPQGLIKKTLPNCEEYCVYESTVIDPSPGYRIGLIFDRNRLIAIEHSRPLNLGNYKTYKLRDNTELYVFRLPPGLNVKTFLEKIQASRAGAD